MDIKKVNVYQDYLNGVITGSEVSKYVKYYKDVKKLYKNEDSMLRDDTIMYEVYSYEKGDPNQSGNLNWGLTVMKPVYVDGECNVTRGHFHQNLDCAEIYFCLHGEGLLLYMDETGYCFAEKMELGSVHHIDGNYAHRLVNTGSEELRVGACWAVGAGHDYERIEQHPFNVRIYKKENEIIVKERT